MCVTERDSVEQAYLAQHQHWDALLILSVVRVRNECFFPPGRGQAGILPQQPPTHCRLFAK